MGFRFAVRVGVTAPFLIALATSGFAGSSAAGSVVLAPHRAVYDLSLVSADDRSGVTGVVGRLVSEFSGDVCEGYTLNMRRVLRISTSQGGTNLFDTLTTSWESGDGNQMRFSTRLYVNGRLADDIAGDARLPAEGAAGTVEFDKPEQQKALVLPVDTVFPVEHSKEIVLAALSDETVTRATVFDGGDVETIYTAVTFIGDRIAPEEAQLPQDAELASALADQPAWTVTVSYYENTREQVSEQLPAYEIQVVLFESGVATDLQLTYEGFSLEGVLTELDMLEAGDCDR